VVSADRERLADTQHVLHGPDGSGAVQRVLYAVYVGTIVAFTYGFTVARAVLIESDPSWVRGTLVSPAAAGVTLAVGILLVGVVHAAGRRRGPAVPPLPWVDQVVAGPLDRAVTLREWWVVSATLVVAVTAVVGSVLGGSLWAAHATGPAGLVSGVLAGILLGGVLALAWLAGQVAPPRWARAGSPPVGAWARPARALRLLSLDGLRAQSVRSSHLGGAVLAGDLRAARLEVATPVRRGRHLRLRSHGPVGTVAARDVLGLRRQPGLAVFGTVLVAPGAAAVTWALCEPQVPPVLAVVAVAALYLGTGIWAEGMRLLGDTMGTPRLSGLDTRTEATAHAVVPGAALLGALLVVGLVVRAAVPGAPGPVVVVLWSLGLAALVTGTAVVSAFRGRPPTPAFSPRAGPVLLIAWYGRPVAWAALAGGLLTSAAAHLGALGAPGPGLVAAAWFTTWWARRRIALESSAHRG
jgi:hypothetical protein